MRKSLHRSCWTELTCQSYYLVLKVLIIFSLSLSFHISIYYSLVNMLSRTFLFLFCSFMYLFILMDLANYSLLTSPSCSFSLSFCDYFLTARSLFPFHHHCLPEFPSFVLPTINLFFLTFSNSSLNGRLLLLSLILVLVV